MRRVLSAYDAIIKTLGNNKSLDYRIAVRLFNEQPPLSTTQADDLLATTQNALCDNIQVYKAYLNYHAITGNPTRLVQKYNELKNHPSFITATSSDTDIPAILVHALHDAGDMPEMLRVAEMLRMKSRLAMTNEECGSLLTYLAGKDIKLCEHWYFYLCSSSFILDVAAYNVLVDAFAKAKSGVALHVLGLMQNRGVSPNEDTFASLLRMADTDGNIRTFDRIMGKTITKDACSALLTQCVRTGHFARANELRAFLTSKRGPNAFNVTALNFLLAAYARQGNIARGSALLREMHEIRNAATFDIAAHMYARAGDSRRCRELLEEMHASGMEFSPGVLHALMDLCVLHGDREGCEKIFGLLLQNNQLSSVAYDKLITLYSNSGELEKARESWESMHSKGIEPSTTTYNSIIAAHAKKGQSEECTRFFETMKERQLAPDLGTFAGILTASVQNRNFRVSRKYFEEMSQVVPVAGNAIATMLQYCSWKSSLKNEGNFTLPQ